MTRYALFLIISSLLAMTLAGCMTISGDDYHPDPSAVQGIPLHVAMTDASYAAVSGRINYITYASAFSRPTFHEAKVSMFQFSVDGKSATATYSWNGAMQKTPHTLGDWLSPGIAYQNGVIAFRDTDLGPITGGRYEVVINMGFNPEGPASLYWRDLKSARQFVDSMLAIAAASGSKFKASFFNSALLPDNYPSTANASALPGDASQQTALAKQEALAGHTDQAVALISKVLTTQNDWAVGHHDLAMLYLWEGRYGDAAKEMGIYLALAPNAPNVQESERLVSEWQFLDEAGHR